MFAMSNGMGYFWIDAVILVLCIGAYSYISWRQKHK